MAPVCLLALSGGLAQDPEPSFCSKEKEAALVRSPAGLLEDTFGLEDDAAVIELIEDVAGRVAQPTGANASLDVRVLKNKEPQVQPLPGGYLLVRSELVAGVETEAELAAVLAHSNGHIVSRHGTRNVSGFTGVRAKRPGALCERLDGILRARLVRHQVSLSLGQDRG